MLLSRNIIHIYYLSAFITGKHVLTRYLIIKNNVQENYNNVSEKINVNNVVLNETYIKENCYEILNVFVQNTIFMRAEYIHLSILVYIVVNPR